MLIVCEFGARSSLFVPVKMLCTYIANSQNYKAEYPHLVTHQKDGSYGRSEVVQQPTDKWVKDAEIVVVKQGALPSALFQLTQVTKSVEIECT